LAGETVVAFFSPGCTPCREKLPEFVAYVRRSFDRQQVLAVVVSYAKETEDTAEAAEMANLLAPVARVVVEDDEHVVAKAFTVKAFPAFCVIDAAGKVLTSGSSLERTLVAERT
jgi:hypothetical protein